MTNAVPLHACISQAFLSYLSSFSVFLTNPLNAFLYTYTTPPAISHLLGWFRRLSPRRYAEARR
jgi:hypothetical protein